MTPATAQAGTVVGAQAFHVSDDWATNYPGAYAAGATDPVIEGSAVAWVSPDRRIRLHDLTDGTEQELPDSDAEGPAMGIMSFGDDRLQLSSGGRLLVWPDRRSGVDNIYWYNLDTGQSGSVSPKPGVEQVLPLTNGTLVAWREGTGMTWCQLLKDLSTGVETTLGCGQEGDLGIGAMDGPYVGIYHVDPSTGYRSVVEDVRTGVQTPLPTAGSVGGLGDGIALVSLPGTTQPGTPSLGGVNWAPVPNSR